MRTRFTTRYTTLNAPTRRRGFTLVELTVSITIGILLLGGMGSTILIASHALPGRNDATDATLRAADVVEQISNELHGAETVTQRTATMIEIKVPDRDADLAPETIRYVWSGNPGDPLTRQYNAGTIVNVAEGVHEFDLGYVTRNITTSEIVTTITKSGEILLGFFDGWAGEIATPQNFGVDSSYWAAQFFLASSIPSDATKVTITQARLKLRQGALAGAGTFRVAIHQTEGGGSREPRATPIGTTIVRSAASLSGSYLWQIFPFGDVSLDQPEKEYVIVVTGTAASGTQADAEVLRYYLNKAPVIASNGLWTADGGTKWDPRSNVAANYQFPFYVYGEYETTSSTPTDVAHYFLVSVDIKLRLSTDSSTRVESAAEVLNAPEVSGP